MSFRPSDEFLDSLSPEKRAWILGIVANCEAEKAQNGGSSYNEYPRLKEEVQRNKHDVWGFVIFRCCYASDDDWKIAMDRLKSESSRDLHDSPELAEKLHYTIFEDKDTLDGADIDQVRERFQTWLDTKPEVNEQPQASHRPHSSPRYQICIMINQASLHSILHKPHDVGQFHGEEFPDCRFAIAITAPSWCEEDEYWMKISFEDLMPRWYSLLRHERWEDEYKEPPRIAMG